MEGSLTEILTMKGDLDKTGYPHSRNLKVAQLPEIGAGYLMAGGRILCSMRDHHPNLPTMITRIEGISHIQSSVILKSFGGDGTTA
ncbi:hypothetical protein CAF53_18245 [Sphingobium sp. LB126]|nr:hypothetical protein CAF53_18245 [Sphingobium sp. LB126]